LFKSGERNTGMAAVMIPFAAPLSPQDMRDLGAFFATKQAGAGIADDTVVEGGAYAGMKFYEIGQQLYRAGDAARGIPACMACHGDRRLEAHHSGAPGLGDRHVFAIMAEVPAPLTDQEIQALAGYLQGLDQRPDAATLAASEAAGPVAAPAPAPASAAPAAE